MEKNRKVIVENVPDLQVHFEKQHEALLETRQNIQARSLYPKGPYSAYSDIQLRTGAGYRPGTINPVAPALEFKFKEPLRPPPKKITEVYSSYECNKTPVPGNPSTSGGTKKKRKDKIIVRFNC